MAPPMGYAVPMPTYQMAPPPSPAGPSMTERASSVPGVCTSQTYQTLAIPKGNEFRTVATKTTIVPGNLESGTKTDAKKEDIARADLDALSPIEAAFQVGVTPGQSLGQLVFEPPRPVLVSQDPQPYVPWVPRRRFR